MIKNYFFRFVFFSIGLGFIHFANILYDGNYTTTYNNIKIIKTCGNKQELKIDGQPSLYCRSEICAIGKYQNKTFYIPEEYRTYQNCSCPLKENQKNCCIPFLDIKEHYHGQMIAYSENISTTEIKQGMFLLFLLGLYLYGVCFIIFGLSGYEIYDLTRKKNN